MRWSLLCIDQQSFPDRPAEEKLVSSGSLFDSRSPNPSQLRERFPGSPCASHPIEDRPESPGKVLLVFRGVSSSSILCIAPCANGVSDDLAFSVQLRPRPTPRCEGQACRMQLALPRAPPAAPGRRISHLASTFRLRPMWSFKWSSCR